MKRLKSCLNLLFLSCALCVTSQTTIHDAETEKPVSYATISFGNGQGLFADNEGYFVFKEKLYKDIDSLFISALGYV